MKALTFAALLVAAPFTASAETLTLAAPLAGGTVHTDTVDMSVYWTAAGDSASEVVATYVAAGNPAEPQVMRMRLEDGDSVVFGLPGHAGDSWNFARKSGAVTVNAAPLKSQLAMN